MSSDRCYLTILKVLQFFSLFITLKGITHHLYSFYSNKKYVINCFIKYIVCLIYKFKSFLI